MSPQTKEQNNESSSKADRACAICRERKIRCGRERPKCTNCRRQGWKCDYSAPEKRVSHIKLLCDNVSSLDCRLGNIETELFRLTKIQGCSHSSAGSEHAASRRDSPAESPFPQEGEGEITSELRLVMTRRIIHSPMSDRYYGPDTLYAWCASFRDFVHAEQQSQGTSNAALAKHSLDLMAEDDSDLLNKCLAELTTYGEIHDIVDIDGDDNQILLPPKQFLLTLHTRFFHQSDWNTNLFVQSRFWTNVERVYSCYSPPRDEVWAIVFNTIILLSLSADSPVRGHANLISSQFAQPFFSTIRAALKRLYLFLTPKLINVQALALLSLVTELFNPPGVAESVFAQACLLARRMGLNQVAMVGHGIDSTEQEERLKTYRSLYVRDKSLGILRGTVCWLPGFEIQHLGMDESESAEASYNAARVKISAFQERVYRLHSSANAQADFAHKSGFHPLGIRHGLAELLDIGNIFGPDTSNIPDIDLWLEFLATRIIALRHNPKPSYMRRTLQDSRACCILLLMAFGKSSNALRQRLNDLCDIPDGCQGLEPSLPDQEKDSKQHTPFLSRNLLDIFPVSALFLLASNIIHPVTADQQPRDDLELLSNIYACYNEASETVQTKNRVYAIGQALGKLLDIIEYMNGMTSTRDLSLTSTKTSATDISGGTLSSQGLSFNPRTPDFLPELINWQQLAGQDLITPSTFAAQQNCDSLGLSLTSVQTAGLDAMDPFAVANQQTSGAGTITQGPPANGMMAFDDPHFEMGPSR